MGVRGLTTYINFNQDVILQEYLLHNSNLVVDGHSLCAQLYRLLNCFSAFGGDYDKFASYTRNFFKNLRKCNITPYVLFDGSYEARKLRTAHNRLRSKINGASRLDPVTQGSLQIFPLLLRDVFKEVLTEINVPYTICEFEADDEIAAMARHLNCPVLSYDSDFFIYNVLYIPFNTLNFKAKCIEEDGNKFYALDCKIYRVQQLIYHFGGLKEDMLPLLATLLGNDYVEKRVFNKFFSQLKLTKSKKKKNEQQRCIHTLFKWLQNETQETAIAKILGRLKKNQKDKVFYIIKKSVEGYNRTHCRSLKYFNISNDFTLTESELSMPEVMDHTSDEENDSSNSNDDKSDEESVSDDSEIDDEGPCLPDWFSEGIRHKNIPQAYLNLYTHHLHFCSPQAEDYNDEDSSICILPILRYAFDMLTDFAHENCVYVSREKDSNYKRIFIGQEYSVSRLLETPFSELSVDQTKLYYQHFLKERLPNLDISDIELLPSNLQLFMIALLWWVAKCQVTLAHVHSLLISYLMLDVIDEKTGSFRGHHHFNNKYSKKLEELKKKQTVATNIEDYNLFLNKNKVQYEDCLIAASVLLKHFEMDDSIRKKPKSYDARKMHSFAQFQCCLQHINCLNTLCRQPYESTKYSKCFNGTFVYNVALKLENQIDPFSFIEQYLKGASSVLLFYKNLCTVYERFAEKMSLTTVKWTGKKRRRKKKVEIDDDIAFIVKGFESEVFI